MSASSAALTASGKYTWAWVCFLYLRPDLDHRLVVFQAQAFLHFQDVDAGVRQVFRRTPRIIAGDDLTLPFDTATRHHRPAHPKPRTRNLAPGDAVPDAQALLERSPRSTAPVMPALMNCFAEISMTRSSSLFSRIHGNHRP